MHQLFWINPDITTAVVVAIKLLSLSDGVPYVAVTRKRGPVQVVDVNACVAKIPSKTLAVIELWSLTRALVIHPGGEEHARQQSHRHAAHMSCPPESAPGQVELEGL